MAESSGSGEEAGEEVKAVGKSVLILVDSHFYTSIYVCFHIRMYIYVFKNVKQKCEALITEEGVFFVEKPSLLPRKRPPFFVQIKTFFQRIFGKGSGIFFRKKGCGAKLFKGVGLPGFCVKEVKG